MKHGKQIVKETHTTKHENLHVLILQTHQKKTLKIKDNFHRRKKTKNKIQKQDISCMKPC
jgi:hypothetical protein